MATFCLGVSYTDADQPQAEFKLEIPHHKRAHGEAIDFSLTVANSGDVPIPVIQDPHAISTRQTP